MVLSHKYFPMWVRIFLGLILGVLAGFIIGEPIKHLKPIGDIFLALIRMVVMPVIFVSLVCGVTAMKDLQQMGRVAIKTLIIYAFTMALASAMAMVLSTFFHVGEGLNYQVTTHGTEIQNIPSLYDTLMSIFPSNPFKAFAEGQVLPVILFAIFFGLAINLTGKLGEPVKHFFDSLNHVVFRLINMVLWFAPFGIFALMAYVTADNGFAILQQLAKVVGTMYLSCALLILGVYSLLLLLFGIKPWPFIKKMFPVQLFAFSTASSNATLPLNMKTAETQLGVHNNIASFVLPLGATVNMNGLATYLGIVTIFAANAYDIHLTLAQKFTAVLTTTLAAIGAAGVPGTALVVMSLVLSSVGLPLEVIAVIAAVDRLLDMMSTLANVSGDTLAAVIVAKTEGDLDKAVYESKLSEHGDDEIPE